MQGVASLCMDRPSSTKHLHRNAGCVAESGHDLGCQGWGQWPWGITDSHPRTGLVWCGCFRHNRSLLPCVSLLEYQCVPELAEKKVLSKYTEGSKSSFLHPVTHLLTFCITCKLHSCPLYMRRCIFQPQSHWGLVEPLFSLLNGRAKSLLSEAIFCFLSRVVKCLWINNS